MPYLFFFEKNFGRVSSNFPTINSPPLILGTSPKAEYWPFGTLCHSSVRPVNVSKPKPFFKVFIKKYRDHPRQTPNS